MGGDLLPTLIAKPLAIFVVDLLVAGDNALVIALLCRNLPARRRGRILLLATLGAVVLRLLLIAGAGALLAVAAMKLLGAALLALIAMRLGASGPRARTRAWRSTGRGVLVIALLLALADVALSLDNVVALAVIAGDDPLALALGLGGSIVTLMFGSTLLARMIAREPWLGRLGAALLGAIAGRMAVSDPLIAGWITRQAPALPLVVPLLVAGYVAFVGAALPSYAGAGFAAPTAAPQLRPPVPAARAPARARLARSGISLELAIFLVLFGAAGMLLAGVVILGGPPIR
jgi:YjbE family integral membrane protein